MFNKLSPLPLALSISAALFASGCNDSNDDNKVAGATVKENIKFAIVSDTHIYDPMLGNNENGEFFEVAITSDRKAFLKSNDLLGAALDALISQGTDMLLVPGDLTKDGEVRNHEMVRASLQKAVDAGIPVFVVPGNHDINNPYGYQESKAGKLTGKGAVYLEGNAFQKTPGSMAPHMTHISADSDVAVHMDNWDKFYADFGFNQAIDRDEHSYSYVAEPFAGVWVMAIDSIYSSIQDIQNIWDDEEEYKNYGKTGGTLLAPKRAKTFEWVKDVAAKAKAEGKILLTITHAGVVEHFPGKNALISQYVHDSTETAYTKEFPAQSYSEVYTNTFSGETGTFEYNSPSEIVSKELADAGVNLVFTGHFHANDIAKRQYSDNSWLYDIQTGATVSYPAPYRTAELDLKTRTLHMDVNNEYVQGAVPDADLAGLVDGLSENILAALGLDVPDAILGLLDSLLLKKSVAATMVEVFKYQNECVDAEGNALPALTCLRNEYWQNRFQSEVLANLDPELQISWQALDELTLSTLIGAVLKAHYHGNEAQSRELDDNSRYVLQWARELGDAYPTSREAMQQRLVGLTQEADFAEAVSPRYGTAPLAVSLSALYGLLAKVGEGITYDPVPDLGVSIDLQTGELNQR